MSTAVKWVKDPVTREMKLVKMAPEPLAPKNDLLSADLPPKKPEE